MGLELAVVGVDREYACKRVLTYFSLEISDDPISQPSIVVVLRASSRALLTALSLPTVSVPARSS